MNRYFIRIFVIVVIAVFTFSCKTAKLSDSDKYESKAAFVYSLLTDYEVLEYEKRNKPIYID